jgi:hypothetical protein
MTWIAFDGIETLGPQRVVDIREFVNAHPESCIEHDIEWLAARAQFDGRALRLYVFETQGGVIKGFAPFLLHPSTLSIDFFSKSLFSIRTKRLTINKTALIDVAERDENVLMLQALMKVLDNSLRGFETAYVLGCPTDGELYTCLTSPVRTALQTITISQPSARRKARVAASLDEYLGILGATARQDLRRNERKLLKHVNDNVECRVYSSVHEVEEFILRSSQISEKTYQTKAFGAGVRNDELTLTLLKSAAKLGIFRGYILFCDGSATAFMLGYAYDKTYYSEFIGYLPQWKDWGVGNTLHIYVMKDLARLGNVTWFDFMYGDNPNKARLATDSNQEQNIIIFSRKGFNRWVGMIYGGSINLSAFGKAKLERMGFAQRLRNRIRSA